MNEYKLVLMYNDDKTLQKIENDEYFKVDDEEFMAFTPQTTGFALLIPKEEIGVDNTNE